MPVLPPEQGAHADDRLSLICQDAARPDIGLSQQTTGTPLKENGYYLRAPGLFDRILGFKHPEPRGHQLQVGIREDAAALLDGGLDAFQQRSNVRIHAKDLLEFGGGKSP